MTGGNVLASIPSGFSGVIVDNITDPPLFLNLPISNNIEMLDGNDFVDISGGTIGTAAAPVGLDLGAGADQFDMSGGSITGSIFGGDGDDDIEVSGNAIITGVPGFSAAIETGAGNNEVRILGGTIGTDPTLLAIFLEDGANFFEMSAGTVNGTVVGQGGGNTYTIDGGVINGSLFAGSANDTVTIAGNAVINASPGQNDAIGLDTGDDAFTMTGGAINGDVSGNAGNDAFAISGGSVNGNLSGNDGADAIAITGGSITGSIFGGDGTDDIEVSGNTIITGVAGISAAIETGAGNNEVRILGARSARTQPCSLSSLKTAPAFSR